MVGPTPPPVHGVAAYVERLLESPAIRRRWDVVYLDTADRRSLANLGRMDLTNVALGVRHVAAFVRLVRRTRAAAVWIPVSQNAPAYLRDALFIAAAHGAGARVVTHLHGAWFDEFYRRAAFPVRAVVRASSARVDRAWVLGESLRGIYGELIPADRIRVIPNGVADPLAGEQTADGRAQGARAGRSLTLLHLGQLSVAKGVVDLIEAAARVGSGGTELRLVLAGPWLDSSDKARIRAVIAASPVRDRIDLPGLVTGAEKSALLAAADVFVLATRYLFEGQPLAILEAMAAGLPVIATARGVIPDMVRHGETGLVVPEADVGALAAALERLAGDPDLRLRMGEAGRRAWRERFTLERALARVVEALEEVRPPDRRPNGPPPVGYLGR